MIQWSPHQKVISDRDIQLRTLVSLDHTYSELSSDNLRDVRRQLIDLGESHKAHLSVKKQCIKHLKDTLK